MLCWLLYNNILHHLSPEEQELDGPSCRAASLPFEALIGSLILKSDADHKHALLRAEQRLRRQRGARAFFITERARSFPISAVMQLARACLARPAFAVAVGTCNRLRRRQKAAAPHTVLTLGQLRDKRAEVLRRFQGCGSRAHLYR